MDRGAWWAAVHGVAQSRTRLSDFTFTFHFHALENEMATHSSVLAPTACPTDTHREKPVSIQGEETPLKSSSAPGETLGKRLRHWGMSKVTQRELALGLWGGERGWAGRSMDPGFEGPEVHTG